MEPLTDVMFTRQAVFSACHAGCIKVWQRPGPTLAPASPTHTLSATSVVEETEAESEDTIMQESPGLP